MNSLAYPTETRNSVSLEACDDDVRASGSGPRYCPTQLLADFALLMAGHGRCVNTSMMLGDREYAMWQLGCARAMGDAELELLARRLFAYFEGQARAAAH